VKQHIRAGEWVQANIILADLSARFGWSEAKRVMAAADTTMARLAEKN